jgi:anti-sigma factor RsiW
MPCAELADMLLEYAGLSVDERARVDDHVAGCGACRELLQALHAVDGELTAEFAGHEVSADFETAVRRRVGREAALPGPSRVPELLDSLGWIAIVALIGLIVWWAAPLLRVAQENLAVTFNMVWVAAAAFLFISFFVGVRSFVQLKH